VTSDRSLVSVEVIVDPNSANSFVHTRTYKGDAYESDGDIQAAQNVVVMSGPDRVIGFVFC
jgi:hypothetical protein